MINNPVKAIFIAGGWASLSLALLGIFLPILPTTPLVLLAAYFFSKGSQRLHRWLIAQPRLGKLILDWEDHGVIRRKAKITATLMMVALFSYTLFFGAVPLVLKAFLVAIGVGVLLFIWTRPSAPVAMLPHRARFPHRTKITAHS